MDKYTLLDVIQDAMLDIKTCALMDNTTKVSEIAERILQITYKAEVGSYLDKLEVGKKNDL